jgi:hypothetical protein
MSRLRLLLLSALLVLACAGGDEPSRVLVLGLDGLDPQTVDLLMSEGRMPSFAKLRQEGAYGRLLSQEPLLSPIIWTTIATGKTPDQHGIGHFVAVSQTTGESLPVTSRMRRVKALWNVASDAGREVAVVGWWATWPPETVNGAVVSDHTAYHFLFEDGFDGGAASDRTYPPELFARLAPLLRRPADVTPEDLAPFVDVTPEEVARPFDFKDELAHFRWALATAESYRDVGSSSGGRTGPTSRWSTSRAPTRRPISSATSSAPRASPASCASSSGSTGGRWKRSTASPTACSAVSSTPWTSVRPWSSFRTTASSSARSTTTRRRPATCGG